MMISLANFVVVIAIALLAGAAPIPRTRVTKRGSDDKVVASHFMIGNAYPYTSDTWLQDIKLAHDNGIDAFALNVGTNDWESDQVDKAYQAAKDSGTDFKLFMSFDMTVMPCGSPQDASALRDYITRHADHPNQLRYKGDVFASTFAGDTCTFGSGSSPDGWKSQFIDQLTGNNKVHFVPAFFSDPKSFKDFDNVIDGVYNWNSGWAVELTTEKASTLLQPLGGTLPGGLNSTVIVDLVGSIQPDTVYLNGLADMQGESLTYMAAASAWFFAHYGPGSLNKNWIYMSNDHLYNKRWETIVKHRDQLDIIQVVSWNDYGESHYIGPIEGDQPNSQDWVDGFNHTAWLDMTSYYAHAFKTGTYPEITQDKLYLWARPHPKEATASSDPLGKPTSYELLADCVFAVVMATSPSKVTLSNGPSSQTVDVPAGLTKLTIPISAGGTMYGKIERDGNTIVELDPEFTFDPNPKYYNYNALVAFAVGDENQPNNSSVSPSSTVISSSSQDPLATPSPSLPTFLPLSSSPSPPTSSPYPSTSPPLSSSPSSTPSPSSSPSSSCSSGGPTSNTTPGPSPSAGL